MVVVTERTRRVVEWVASGVWQQTHFQEQVFVRCAFCGNSAYSEHEPGCVVTAAREEVESWEADKQEEELQAEIAEAAVRFLPNLDGVIYEETEVGEN